MLQGRRRYLFGLRASAAVAVLLLAGLPAGADTLEQALVQSYQNNPQLNAQRASARSAAVVHGELTRGLNSLATIASTAPWVGLFGTVLGIYNSFGGTVGSRGDGRFFHVFERQRIHYIAPGRHAG